MQPIYIRNIPPPLETFDHVNFLTFFAGWIRPECYLELGVRDGRCFSSVAPYCKLAIGVDVIPPKFPLMDNCIYENISTDDYFKKIKDTDMKFDMVFIDADHSFEQSYQDFLNVKDLVVEDGFVFFHDTYPYDEFMLSPNYSDSCYKTAIEIREQFHGEWEILTLPFNPGVTISKKIYNRNGLPWMAR